MNVRPYCYPYSQKAEIEKQITELLKSGLIRVNHNPFSLPVLLVKKKDGCWRMCIDYRALNCITICNRFPMPTIDELLDDLGMASWFTKLDLRKSFHQILMAEDDIPKRAFRMHHDHYECHVMSFGLCNTPSTFQATMNSVLRPFLHQFVAVFFDDILVFNDSLATHIEHLDTMLNTLLQSKLYLKRSKCYFVERHLEYLGHVIFGEDIAPEQSKIAAMVTWPTPTSAKDIQGFLGLTGFYRHFIKGYASLTASLTALMCRDQFKWSPESQLAFDALKSAMTQAPVLIPPDFS